MHRLVKLCPGSVPRWALRAGAWSIPSLSLAPMSHKRLSVYNGSFRDKEVCNGEVSSCRYINYWSYWSCQNGSRLRGLPHKPVMCVCVCHVYINILKYEVNPTVAIRSTCSLASHLILKESFIKISCSVHSHSNGMITSYVFIKLCANMNVEHRLYVSFIKTA